MQINLNTFFFFFYKIKQQKCSRLSKKCQLKLCDDNTKLPLQLKMPVLPLCYTFTKFINDIHGFHPKCPNGFPAIVTQLHILLVLVTNDVKCPKMLLFFCYNLKFILITLISCHNTDTMIDNRIKHKHTHTHPYIYTHTRTRTHTHTHTHTHTPHTHRVTHMQLVFKSPHKHITAISPNQYTCITFL